MSWNQIWGHRAKRTSSPWRSSSCCDEVCSDNSWRCWHWLNLWLAEKDCSTDRWLSHRRSDDVSRWQWCLTIFAECPLVLLTELSVKKRSNGIVDRPLYNLNTSNRSTTRFRLSSNDHVEVCYHMTYASIPEPFLWTCTERALVVICLYGVIWWAETQYSRWGQMWNWELGLVLVCLVVRILQFEIQFSAYC